MNAVDVISLISSVASIILAVLAIWLALYHKRESDQTNLQTRDLLLEVRSDARTVATVAIPEMKAYGQAMRDYIFTGASTERQMLRKTVATGEWTTPQATTGGTMARLSALASQIDEGEGYTRQQRGEAMRLLREVHQQGLASDPEFPSVLEMLVDTFVSSDQARSIETIQNLFNDVVIAQPGILTSMLQYTSIKMLGDGPERAKARDWFMKYAEAAKNTPAYADALHPMLVLLHSEGNPNALKSLVQQFRQMDFGSVDTVLEGLQRRADPFKVQQRPDRGTRVMAEKYRRFNAEFYNELSALDGTTAPLSIGDRLSSVGAASG